MAGVPPFWTVLKRGRVVGAFALSVVWRRGSEEGGEIIVRESYAVDDGYERRGGEKGRVDGGEGGEDGRGGGFG